MKYQYVRTYETKDRRGGFIHPIMSPAQQSIPEVIAKRIVEELNKLYAENENLHKTSLLAIQRRFLGNNYDKTQECE